jgi:hypothetical protein
VIYRRIGQKTWNSALDNALLKRCSISNARRETRRDTLQVIGNQIAPISIGSHPDQRMLGIKRVEPSHEAPNGFEIGRPGHCNPGVETGRKKRVLH